MARRVALPSMVPPGIDRSGSPGAARLVVLPLVGTLVTVVAVVTVLLVAGAPGPLVVVVVVVSSPRRYLPSSVPPHPATRMAQADTRAAVGFALCIANPRPPGPRQKLCSLPTWLSDARR